MAEINTASIINGYTNQKDVIITLNTELWKIVIRETLGFKNWVKKILETNWIDVANITQSSINQAIETLLWYITKKMWWITKWYTSESFEFWKDGISIKSSITVMEAN
jgi:hypothetical protein